MEAVRLRYGRQINICFFCPGVPSNSVIAIRVMGAMKERNKGTIVVASLTDILLIVKQTCSVYLEP